MKTLRYTNQAGNLAIDYLVDLIGDADMLTNYQVKQTLDGVTTIGIGEGAAIGMPDKYEQVVNDDASRDKYTLTWFKQLATDKNLTLTILEEGEAPVVVNASPTALDITTTSVAGGNDGVAYSVQLAATGGNAPYSFATEDPLPAGIILTESGLLYGVPTETGTFDFDVVCTDAFGATDTQSLSLVISA